MAMAPLYKRYIPPKASASAAAVPVSTTPAKIVNPAAEQKSSHNGAPHEEKGEGKRKRDRSEEEIAERKAKKLRKKGVDPATATEQANVLVSQDAEVKQNGESGAKAAQVGQQDGEKAVSDGAGKDGQKMSIKKRHKLEKEARKVKKAEAKAVKEVDEPGLEIGAGESGSQSQKLQQEAHTVQDQVMQDEVVEDADKAKEPKKPKKKRKGDESAVDLRAASDDHNMPDAVNIEDVKMKDKKRRQTAKESDTVIDQPARDVDIEVSAASLPKKRRHKLESTLVQASEETTAPAIDDDEEAGHLSRHGGVIEKFQKSTQKARDQRLPSPSSKHSGEDANDEQPVLHDLVPLPQPEKAPTPEFTPDVSALPPWLAKPTVVSSDAKATFSELGLQPETAKHLKDLGFIDALPVQQALTPLLLPPGSKGAKYLAGTESVVSDLAVSAATGSGKTIAYVLPVIEALKQRRRQDQLKAVVVVPTRELVAQVAAVAESLVKPLGQIKVGTATGTGKLRDEQEKLVHRSYRYDRTGYQALMEKAKRQQRQAVHDPSASDEDEDEMETDEYDTGEIQRLEDALRGPIDHVPVYSSTVDILVCTPGRLLEHLNITLGFGLKDLEWLILDEADKLLDAQYDGFLERVNEDLTHPQLPDRLLAGPSGRVRKVVLSATMTRDVSKLAGLRLHRPQMIVVRSTNEALVSEDAVPVAENTLQSVRQVGEGYELPPSLVEYCVPVGDGSEKPLYLLKTLEEKMLNGVESKLGKNTSSSLDAEGKMDVDDKTDSESSDTESLSSSSLSSSSSEPSDSSSNSTPSSANSRASSPEPTTPSAAAIGLHPSRAALLSASEPSSNSETPTILIFTSSNESASRLHHLLAALKPSWRPYLLLLTKSQPAPTRTSKSSTSASSKSPLIAISTDRSSRGLDSLSASHRPITHVLQYDVPRSLTSYIHRVGRTARAGRAGEAWTLYSHAEARWFLKDVARSESVKRGGVVEKVKLAFGEGGSGQADEDLRRRFEGVVEDMRESVFGGGGEGRG
ncbi:hypothetical protein B0A50_06685 [Salinomyces thailandicus]|uniref:ATP-dependent RNA helicase n=1 Tax=Salinomyces thailandicus TaxID=706561 RepID=A0A4U0TR00_9PEZI|nr:hypothetical protein B0A50_06685 [Salinomyces thailandica]